MAHVRLVLERPQADPARPGHRPALHVGHRGAAAGHPAVQRGGAIEAPTIHRRGGYYYLFASFDFCCRGAASTYRIMVGRSTSVTGPYVDRNGTAMTAGGGTEVLAGHGSVHGPGHQAVLTDTDGDVLFYHYYADNGDVPARHQPTRLGLRRLAVRLLVSRLARPVR